MMEKEFYKDIIEEVSNKLAEKAGAEETDLASRSTLIDQDIQGVVQEIGLQTTKKILESTRDKIVVKKKFEGLTIHRNPTIEFNTIFGKVEIKSPYLWVNGIASKPLADEMKITHQGRSETVKRALSDFGIESSFSGAAKRFKEHYHFNIGSSTVSRSTKQIAHEAMDYIEHRFSRGV